MIRLGRAHRPVYGFLFGCLRKATHIKRTSTMPRIQRPKIEVRKATVGDYQSVLDIDRNVDQGLDYLPYQYHELVTDPDCSYYVCLVDGEVCALLSASLLDDNKTLMARSGRVKPNYRSMGLLNVLKERIYKDYKDIPGEKNKAIPFNEVDVTQMRPVCGNLEDAKPISLGDFRHLLEIEDVKKYLFPKNLITTNFWFYEAVPSNIKHIGKWSSQIIITSHLYKFLPGQRNSQINTGSNSNSLDKGENHTQGLLGIVVHYFSATHLLFAINLFGRPTKGKEIEEITALLKQALVLQRSLCSDKTKNQKVVCVFSCHDRDTPTELFHEAAKPFGFLPSTWTPGFTEHYYLEQNFDDLLVTHTPNEIRMHVS